MTVTTILLWILAVFLVLWWIGCLITTIYVCFFDPRITKEEKKQGWLGNFIVMGVLNMLFWPQSLPQFHAQRKFHNDLKAGKRPKWLVRNDNETDSHTWTLSDGTEFEAAVVDSDSTEDCCIVADYVNRRKPGDIECRVRMVAPAEQPFSEWMIAAPYKSKHKIEPDLDDGDEDWTPMRNAFYGKFDRGKYHVEFRVETKVGVFETCSHLTMIVSDTDDYG